MQRTLLVVCNRLKFISSHRFEILETAARKGWTVIVFAPIDDTLARYEKAGIQVVEWRLDGKGLNPIKEAAAFLRLVQRIRTVRPTVLHLVAIKPVIYGGIAGRICGVRGIVSAISGRGHVYSSKRISARILRVLADFLYRLAIRPKRHVVVFQNTVDRDHFVSRNLVQMSNTVMTKGSGVNLRQFFPPARDEGSRTRPMRVLFAARLLWTKGVGEYVAVAKEMIGRHPGRIEFLIAGSPDPLNPESVSDKDLEDWKAQGIRVLGHIDDLSAVMRDVDVFCYPTVYGEGVPKVLLEAAASGLPIVATDWPGCDEVVDEGCNGYLVTPRAVPEFVERLERLLADTSLRRALEKASRCKAEAEFGVETVVNMHHQVYEKLS